MQGKVGDLATQTQRIQRVERIRKEKRMKLINVDAFRKDHGMGECCADCKRNTRDCNYDQDYTLMDFCGWLDDAEIVLDEHDLIELRHRFGKWVEFVVRDMISGKGERWKMEGKVNETD